MRHQLLMLASAFVVLPATGACLVTLPPGVALGEPFPASENLVVRGRRLDRDAPPADISRTTNAHSPSLGGWTMLVAVEFPSPGCWEITGEYLGQKLSFVVSVPSST
jgi:hypothetical protein